MASANLVGGNVKSHETHGKVEKESRFTADLYDKVQDHDDDLAFKRIDEIARRRAAARELEFTRISKLQEYQQRDRVHPMNQAFPGDPEFQGPVFERECTDKIWIAIFIVFALGQIIFAGIIIDKGDIRRLINGDDFRGEVCSIDQRSNKLFVYWPDPIWETKLRLCHTECPLKAGPWICLYAKDGQTPLETPNSANPDFPPPYCYQQIQTTYWARYCIPYEPVNRSIIVAELTTLPMTLKATAGDFERSDSLIAIGVAMSIFISWLYLQGLMDGRTSGIIVWSSIVGTVVSLSFVSWCCWKEYKRTVEVRCIDGLEVDGCGGLRATSFRRLTFVIIGLICVYVLIMILIWRKIALAIKVIKLTTAALVQIPNRKLVIVPALAAAILVGLFTLCVLMYGMSIGTVVEYDADKTPGGKVNQIKYNLEYRNTMIFFIFMFLWWLGIIQGCVYYIISSAMSMWFFTRRKETLHSTIQISSRFVFRYHLGSICYGVLISTILMPIRLTISFIKGKLERGNQKSPVVKFFSNCLNCCFYIFEYYIKYISTDSLIHIAIWGEPFFKSGVRSYYLTRRNEDRITNLAMIEAFTIFQTKISASFYGCAFVYWYLVNYAETPTGKTTREVDSPINASLFVFGCAYFFASIFAGLYDMGTVTLLQCLAMDEEMFAGGQKFAEDFIIEFMDDLGEESTKQHWELKNVQAGRKFNLAAKASAGGNSVKAKKKDALAKMKGKVGKGFGSDFGSGFSGAFGGMMGKKGEDQKQKKFGGMFGIGKK
eukprot:CAMPEP_0115013302 /NCGR_PEP_ID=MMETSP0216-20121206/25316_1 /TAXON_ID=223996 /ORGANISM="Protocruzia adherens, Strain Boccale" /LENGTH=770 /DNA_ID=CAMNT_0002382653 /DNA_START=38 /DNA_END=2350 /DNA_ORIENTATION=+